MDQQTGGLVSGASQDGTSFNASSVGKTADLAEKTNPSELLPSESDINNNPLIAGDDDLIEKEWVERAKRLVEETHGDPHKQDNEVNKLQADYVNKRYSKKLGSS